MNKQKTQDEYKLFIKDKNFIEIARLMKKSNIKPAEFSVRVGVKTYLEEKHPLRIKLFFILKLIEITTVNVDANIIQDICKLMLDLGTPYTLEYFSKKTEINDEIFKNIKGYIQKHYSIYIKEGLQVELVKLMEISKINPSENLVFEGYKTYLEEGNIISFVNLKKRTEVEPREELILEMFELYKNKSNGTVESDEENNKEYWEKRIEKLSKATGIEFKDQSK